MEEEDKKCSLVLATPKKEINDDPLIGILGTSDGSGEFKNRVLIPYFTDLFQDLCNKSSTKGKGISRITFFEFIRNPGLIGERLFNQFDKNKDNIIDLTEFLLSMLKLYSGSLEIKEKFIFDMYDFDKDGLISKEDVRTLLLSLPIQKKTNSSIRKFSADVEIEREESVEQLDKFIEKCFESHPVLNLKDFKSICKNESSELFLGLYLTIKTNLPCSTQFEKYKKFKDLKIEGKQEVQEKYATPKLLTKFLPISTIIKKSSPQGKAQTNIKLDKYFNDLLILNPSNSTQSALVQDSNTVRLPNQIKSNEQIMMSPSGIIMESDGEKESIFCKCGRNIKDELETKCEVCRNIDKIGIIEGDPYKLSHDGKYRKSCYILDKHELVHKSRRKPNKYCSRVLTSCFIEEELEDSIDNIPFYSFQIIWTDKTLKLGFYNKEEYNKWVNALKTIIGYSNIFDFYKIDDKIGAGKFSTVYKGNHIKTGETVAIKIISKHSMKPVDVENVFREIEILKLCQHPNIIRLYDVFVNAEYIYIVQECLPGGDLYKYLEKINFNLEMQIAQRFIEEISRALDYMHSFGIVHRDLKPENILLSDNSNLPQLKIVDFGLSKMIGPKEKCTEPFGTLGYVAPEIIQRKEYTQNVDIWSLGIITHLLVLGNLPFDDESEKEVAK